MYLKYSQSNRRQGGRQKGPGRRTSKQVTIFAIKPSMPFNSVVQQLPTSFSKILAFLVVVVWANARKLSQHRRWTTEQQLVYQSSQSWVEVHPTILKFHKKISCTETLVPKLSEGIFWALKRNSFEWKIPSNKSKGRKIFQEMIKKGKSCSPHCDKLKQTISREKRVKSKEKPKKKKVKRIK